MDTHVRSRVVLCMCVIVFVCVCVGNSVSR